MWCIVQLMELVLNNIEHGLCVCHICCYSLDKYVRFSSLAVLVYCAGVQHITVTVRCSCRLVVLFTTIVSTGLVCANLGMLLA